MKKKRLWAGLLFLLISLFSGEIYAKEVQTVTLTEDDKLIYEQKAEDLQKAFTDMAPGDTRTIAIKLQNKNSHAADFFLSESTIDAFEEVNKSSGAAYEFTVSIGAEKDNAEVILNTVAGGYTDELKASTEGLFEIRELKDYRHIAKLEKGGSTNLYLTLTLDGEGMDSTDLVDYSNATGALELNFKASYSDDGQTVVVTNQQPKDIVKTNIINQIAALPQSVKTGDTLPVTVIGAFAVCGAGMIWFAARKRRVSKNEK